MTRKKKTLLFIALLFFVAISFPVMALFNTSELVFGFPSMLVYLFVIWVILVFALYRINTTTNQKSS